MKNILVTGAAGFTGRHLAKLLTEQGHELHGIVHERVAEPIEGFARIHEADICEAAAIRQVVNEVRPDQVVHLAAIAFVAHGDVDQMYRVNIIGTRHLLDALSRLDAAPSAVLLASSANVYGSAREGVLDERTPPAPANDYGVTKLAMENVASLYRPVLPLVIARPFNYTGRGQGPEFIVPKIVQHVRDRAQTIELGNVDVARDFSDVRFVADTYSRLLSSAEAVGGTFNVCSGRAVSLRDVVTLACRIAGHQLTIHINPKFVRSHEIRTLHGSPALVEKTIGPLRPIPLEETLRWMIDE